jgi:hypothetical protein
VNFSSVVPDRRDVERDRSHDELRISLRGLGAAVEAILSDGSGPSRMADA